VIGVKEERSPDVRFRKIGDAGEKQSLLAEMSVLVVRTTVIRNGGGSDMKLEADDIRELTPVIAEVVRATLDEIDSAPAKLDSLRLGYGEAEAAAMIGIKKDCLRDCRLRGELTASRVGRRIIYSLDELKQFLKRRSI